MNRFKISLAALAIVVAVAGSAFTKLSERNVRVHKESAWENKGNVATPNPSLDCDSQPSIVCFEVIQDGTPTPGGTGYYIGDL